LIDSNFLLCSCNPHTAQSALPHDLLPGWICLILCTATQKNKQYIGNDALLAVGVNVNKVTWHNSYAEVILQTEGPDLL